MFTDTIRIKVFAGKGGNGVVTWRREKYIAKGGPTGGSGGKGGDIVIKGDENVSSLDWYRNNRILKAESGHQGGSNQKIGRQGKNLIIKVPPGTLIKNATTNELICDITENNQTHLLLEGGRGGRGNATFKTSVKQAPNYCTPGKEGEELNLELELKIIADIGLVGFPNAGKSTLINSLTTAKAKCDAYPFTTLNPNIGFIETPDYLRYYLADIPGIIEGASKNKGLGFKFLKHIERTKILFYILDVSQEDPIKEFQILHDEIEAYNPEILKKPALVLLNKTDLEDSQEKIDSLLSHFKQYSPLAISAFTGDGLDGLMEAFFKMLRSK